MSAGMLTFRAQYLDDRDPFFTDEIPYPIKPKLYTFYINRNIDLQIGALHQILNAPHKLEDCTIQLYRADKFGPYLDVESTLNDQWKELEQFYDGSKCLFLLRTHPKIRAQTIIDQLRREAENDNHTLYKRLIWLKHIFTSDQDIIHEFVQNDGLQCLIDIGNAYNQYRTHILRAMNKMILYVDGMAGFVEHREVIEWLYSILDTPEQVVLSMTLKLLIIFVEYSESNAYIFIDAAHLIDRHDGKTPFFRMTEILRIQRNPEIMHFCMALINRTIAAIPDQDTFYDVTDWLECQGMQKTVDRLLREYTRYNLEDNSYVKNLLTQLNVYEAVLKLEDGDDLEGHDSSSDVKHLISRKDRLKSAVPRTSLRRQGITGSLMDLSAVQSDLSDADRSTRPHRLNSLSGSRNLDRWTSDVDVITNERRQMMGAKPHAPLPPRRSSQFKDLHSRWETTVAPVPSKPPRSVAKSQMDGVRIPNEIAKNVAAIASKTSTSSSNSGYALGNDVSPKASPQSRNMANHTSPVLEKRQKSGSRMGEVFTAKQQNEIRRVDVTVGERLAGSGLVNRAKDSLTAFRNQTPSSTKLDLVQAATASGTSLKSASDLDLQWERARAVKRTQAQVASGEYSVELVGYSFSDVECEEACDGQDDLSGVPPIPPGDPPVPPAPLPPPLDAPPLPSPQTPLKGGKSGQGSSTLPLTGKVSPLPDTSGKKTIRLHWREVSSTQHLPWLIASDQSKSKGSGDNDRFRTVWEESPMVTISPEKIQTLFEIKQTNALIKKSCETKKELTVLDTKRSNAINIGLKFLPIVDVIRTSILTMDCNVIKRDGIEKLMSMIPSEEERSKIQQAKEEDPDIPLGRAEDFLMLLCSIDQLEARLKVWLFGSDFQNVLRELVEPLHDLKLAMREIQKSETFKQVLSTLLSIGNVLNESKAKSFHIEYLAKVSEVRDVVNKNSLLFHVATVVSEKFHNNSDLHSEIPSIARCGRVDYEDLESKLKKLEKDCEECREFISLLDNKHSPKKYVMCPRSLDVFLLGCREQVSMLLHIHHIVMRRFRRFCIWLGLSLSQIASTNVHSICKTVADFALEYKTVRGEINQLEEKKRNREQRKGRRGQTILGSFANRPKAQARPLNQNCLRGNGKQGEDELNGQSELARHLLNPMLNSLSNPYRPRPRASISSYSSSNRWSGTDTDIGTDGNDEVIDAIVKTAVEPDEQPRTRKTTNLGERKSFRRKINIPLYGEDRLRVDPMSTRQNNRLESLAKQGML